MSDSDPKTAMGQVLELGLTAGTAVALATTATPPTAAAAGGLAVLPAILRGAVDVALRWKEADAARFWHALVNGKEPEGLTSEEVAGLIEAHADEPFVRETVLRSVRTVLDAVDPAVVVPLATLARVCLRDRIPPDTFTRNTMRLLTELGRDELTDLRLLLQWLLKETRLQDWITAVARDARQRSDQSWERIPWEIEVMRDEFVGRQDLPEDPYVRLLGLRNPTRLFYLLRTNGLAQEKGGVSFAAGPNTIVINRVVASRADAVLSVA